MKKIHKRFPRNLLGVIILGSILIMISWGGQVEPFRDEEGNRVENSIAEKVFLETNGVKLGMIIRGKDINNPVLLFLHGGPGVPEYILKEKYLIDLEDYFTVV